jgi:hypothetical protein
MRWSAFPVLNDKEEILESGPHLIHNGSPFNTLFSGEISERAAGKMLAAWRSLPPILTEGLVPFQGYACFPHYPVQFSENHSALSLGRRIVLASPSNMYPRISTLGIPCLPTTGHPHAQAF